MNKPFIILTGDDSVRAEGIILMKRIVEKFADYQIVATEKQQSAIGSALNLKGGRWGKEMVDGHEAIWVDGYPSDAMYFALDYLGRKPDLVVSGVNHGENIENSTLPRSGTIAGAMTASLSRGFPAIAFSRRIYSKDWNKEHNGEFNSDLLRYPGGLIELIIKKALDYKFPEGTFWNVNFPNEPTDKIKVVHTNNNGCYPNKQKFDANNYHYTFETYYENWQSDTDAGALNNGFTTITPCKIEYTDFEQLENLKMFLKTMDDIKMI